MIAASFFSMVGFILILNLSFPIVVGFYGTFKINAPKIDNVTASTEESRILFSDDQKGVRYTCLYVISIFERDFRQAVCFFGTYVKSNGFSIDYKKITEVGVVELGL